MKPRGFHLVAPMLTEELDQSMGRRDISADGVRGSPPIVLEIIAPARRERAGAI
jgi:hypothetical protein